MDPNLTIIERNGYTVLDILSDVDGIQGILFSGALLFLNIWNYNQIEDYLSVKLFKN